MWVSGKGAKMKLTKSFKSRRAASDDDVSENKKTHATRKRCGEISRLLPGLRRGQQDTRTDTLEDCPTKFLRWSRVQTKTRFANAPMINSHRTRNK